MDKARTVAEVKDDIRGRVGRRAPFLHADNAEAKEAYLKSYGYYSIARHADSYLFDLLEARANLFGKKTFDESCAVMPALSLLDQGWLDKPYAPLLIVNGKIDVSFLIFLLPNALYLMPL